MLEPVGRPPLWEGVLEQLRTAILDGTLPSGTKLVEVDLAQRLGTSRGPIRQAIRELVRERLVVEFDRRGNVVSTLDARDLAEVYGVREALESAAAGLVVQRASAEELAELGRLLDVFEKARGSGVLESAAHDLAFHRSFVRLAGNERMADVNEQMLTQTAHLLRIAAAANSTLQTDIRPSAHREIVEALVARDGLAAVAAVAAHYRYAEERLFPGLA